LKTAMHILRRDRPRRSKWVTKFSGGKKTEWGNTITISNCHDLVQYQSRQGKQNNIITNPIQGGLKKVSHHQFFKKIALKIANEIRFLRKVKVW